MAIRTELNLRLPNSPSALGGVCALLSEERVNILAMTLEAGGQLRMVVDNHVHGAAVLREHHHQVTERDVILVPISNSPGALAPALRLIGGRRRQRRIRLRGWTGGEPDGIYRHRGRRRGPGFRGGRGLTEP